MKETFLKYNIMARDGEEVIKGKKKTKNLGLHTYRTVVCNPRIKCSPKIVITRWNKRILIKKVWNYDIIPKCCDLIGQFPEECYED